MGSMFRLGESSVRPAAETKIIKADEYALYLEAASLLDAAREKAAAMEAQAEKAYERKKEEGYRDGMEEGKLEHAEKMMETILSSVEFIEGIEDTLVSVVNQAIRKIIGEMDSKERIVRIVRTALNNVRGQQKVTVRVAPADEEAVTDALEAYRQRQLDTFSWYLSQNLPKVEDARTVIEDGYVFFFIGENADEAEQMFQDFVAAQA